MRPIYIWQYPTWAEFTWDDSRLITLLSEVRNLEGNIGGMMGGVGFDVQSKTSQATALRDIADLINKGILVVASDGGRSTNYLLNDGV